MLPRWGGCFGGWVRRARCLSCAGCEGKSVPRRPAGREVGTRSPTSATNPSRAPADASHHRRAGFNLGAPRARCRGCFARVPPRAWPAPKQRGSGRGARRCPRRLRKAGDAADVFSPPHRKEFQLVFPFLLFPLQFRPRNPTSALHSKPPSDGAVRKTFGVCKKSLKPREYHLKTALKYSAAF